MPDPFCGFNRSMQRLDGIVQWVYRSLMFCEGIRIFRLIPAFFAVFAKSRASVFGSADSHRPELPLNSCESGRSES